MSVGYDLEGIKGDKVNTYSEGMKDATKTAIFGECKAVLKELFPADVYKRQIRGNTSVGWPATR